MSADGPKPPSSAVAIPPPQPPPNFVPSPPAIEVVRAIPKFPDIVKGYWTALGTHLLAGATGAGKTAFMCWFIAWVRAMGEFLGHPAQIPSWLRVICLDRNAEDWRFWSKEAGIDCPKGYWLREDKSISPAQIRKWGKEPELAHQHFRKVLLEMEPEPGGLLITDGALPILGDATVPYFVAWANMVEMQRLTSDQCQLTHIPLVHAGKPKALGSRDAKARHTDKANMNAGAIGAADCASYLSTAEELVGDGETPPPFQRFSWLPHHAKGQTFELARTENGLFISYSERVTELPPERIGRPVDVGRIDWVVDIMREQESPRMLRKEIAAELMSRPEMSMSKPGAYRLITTAVKRSKSLRAEGRFEIVLIELNDALDKAEHTT